jgi:hypothetical protein
MQKIPFILPQKTHLTHSKNQTTPPPKNQASDRFLPLSLGTTNTQEKNSTFFCCSLANSISISLVPALCQALGYVQRTQREKAAKKLAVWLEDTHCSGGMRWHAPRETQHRVSWTHLHSAGVCEQLHLLCQVLQEQGPTARVFLDLGDFCEKTS